MVIFRISFIRIFPLQLTVPIHSMGLHSISEKMAGQRFIIYPARF